MTAAKLSAVRLPESLVDRLDALAARRSRETGIPHSRSTIIRLLLTSGLDEKVRLALERVCAAPGCVQVFATKRNDRIYHNRACKNRMAQQHYRDRQRERLD